MPHGRWVHVRDWLAHPRVGDAMVIASGIAFMGLLMLLPLVGKAGSATPWRAANARTFHTVLWVAILLAVAAAGSKYLRSLRDGSPRPHFSLALIAVLGALWVAFITGCLAR